MSEKRNKFKSMGRSASTDSTEYSITMGKSIRTKRKKPKERWLLTRKTWRYMADAGKKLIPDGAHNKPEDIPKIEAYFQEVCKKESKFLLWRKNSYPGALGFRKKRKNKGGSCRNAVSADEVDNLKPERPKDLALFPTTPGKFDLKKMREDFMNSPPSPTNYLPLITEHKVLDTTQSNQDQLITMLEKLLTINEIPSNKTVISRPIDLNYQELVDKLQHLLTISSSITSSGPPRLGQVHFTGNHMEKALSETLSRYFSQSTNRDKTISDLLTNRKALEKLYFDLRKARGFRGPRATGTYSQTTSSTKFTFNENESRERKTGTSNPPPVIEIVQEIPEILIQDWGVQTKPIPEEELLHCEEEYKKLMSERDEEIRVSLKSTGRRRSSVDNDDVSQSVSDTIKRYLRMARKKSVDSDKADRFKRVNYDRNLRNIKAKGEITKPGDDDGLNKGCQTDENWIVTYRDLKFDYRSDEGLAISPPPTKSHSFFSHFLPHKHDKDKSSSTVGAATGAAMQKSKSSSSVIHQGSRLMSKKIFRSRSKSQTRSGQNFCQWTPQGNCTWSNLSGKQVTLSDTTLLHLSEVERKVLQKVAIAKLQALNLGITVKVPSENVAAIKPKRRPYLLKRKAITTGIFDGNRKDADGASPSGLVFGIPLTQCVENDRIAKAASATTRFSGSDATEESRLGRHGSRASFTSLIDTSRGEETGSCENLSSRERIAGSVPGLLDKISCRTSAASGTSDENPIPQILTACFKYLEEYGLHTLGIFRVSTSKKRIRELREYFDSGRQIDLDKDQCPHDVATLLKEYLRDLPDPLLCRDLYQAFVQTQKLRNRRLQFEALQHLIQLLPAVNRDTLHALLHFLSKVADHAGDTASSGEQLAGNKMDSSNLATVFAPNILHCVKPNAQKEAADRPEDRIDIINVVRTLIDHFRDLFKVPSELLDEVYIYMMDSHPEALNELLNNKKDAASAAEESQEELDSESFSAPWSPTLPTSEISIDGYTEEATTPTEKKKTWSREEFLHESAATGGPNVGMRIRHRDKIYERSRRRRDESSRRDLSRLKGCKDEFGKNRSSSLESTGSFQEDGRGVGDEARRKSSPYGVITASLTIPVQTQGDDDIPFIEEAVVRTPTAPPRRRQRSISGSDSSVGSAQPMVQSIDSAIGSMPCASPAQHTPTSVTSSGVEQLSSPPSWASSPPNSPDSNASYDDTPRCRARIVARDSPILQKVTFVVQQETRAKPRPDICKSVSSPSFEKASEKFTPSITSIGDAVLRSKTADFERISRSASKATILEKKKYTKRRYTDSRHPTRHIPDSESLESSQKEEKSCQSGPVYKRRELISSVPSK